MGLRAVTDQCAAEMGLRKKANGGVYCTARMSNLCTNPPRAAKGVNRQRKRFTTTVTPTIPGTMNGDMLVVRAAACRKPLQSL
jgi:hypothetical protein